MGTAIGARNNTESEKKISFISEAHESFFYEKLSQVRYKDEYHIALVYCLGINADTRQHIDRIYDFKSGLVKPACIHEGWVTSGSARVIRMAFNLYCDGMPSVKCTRQKIEECQNYSVSELFCCSYAPFFWQAIQLRYPEYVTYNKKLDESNYVDGKYSEKNSAVLKLSDGVNNPKTFNNSWSLIVLVIMCVTLIFLFTSS